MIPLNLPVVTDAHMAFVTKLRLSAGDRVGDTDSVLIDQDEVGATFAGRQGLFAIDGVSATDLSDDVLLIEPAAGRAERLLRSASRHNTLLVTERCDQLCVMCSQPPKKTHIDRFDALEQACRLAEPGILICISGGEPTLYKEQLLSMIERVLTERLDLSFHILSNGQHFTEADVDRLRSPLYRRVSWGIPLYAVDPALHDEIVGKAGAFQRLQESFAYLLEAGARVELRTVVLTSNLAELSALARNVVVRLRFVEAWSIMQLENTGYAKGRWRELFVRHELDFTPVADALDAATARGINAQLFNFPLCTVPAPYRRFAIASISDWKKKFVAACDGCSEQSRCSGFFEWHPDMDALAAIEPL